MPSESSNYKLRSLGSPRAEELLQKARDLQPVLRERAAKCAEDSKVPEETIADFKEAGFFRILQSEVYGGYEMDPQVYYAVIIEVAKACMSSAWVLSVIGVHNWQLNLFEPQAAKDVWATDTDVRISSSYAPVGLVTRVEGGFMLSGCWSFSSGCEHCDWVYLGAVVPGEDGSWDMENYRTFLLPRKDYEIQKNWDVIGLKGTGSHDIDVENVFVPEYRTHDMLGDVTTNRHKNKAPLYQLPFMQVFSRAVCTATMGALEAALDDYIAVANSRMSGRIMMRDDADAKRIAARAKSSIETMKLTMNSNFEMMLEGARNGVEISDLDRARFRYESAVVADRCVEHSAKMLKAAGSGSIRSKSPLLSRHLDMQASQAHVANVFDSFEINFGGMLFGHETTELGL